MARVMIVRGAAFAAALLALPPAIPAVAQTPAPVAALPGGTSALQETFDNWQVSCTTQGSARLCRLSQEQRQRDGNQMVLAVELAAAPKDTATGALILPFGLRLADGVTLQVDEGKPSRPLAFSTCLPVGCVVPLTLDAPFVKALRSGTTLKLAAKAQESGATVSLKGFAPGHDRLKGLAGS